MFFRHSRFVSHASSEVVTLTVTLMETDRGYEAEDEKLSRNVMWVIAAKWRKEAMIQLVERRF